MSLINRLNSAGKAAVQAFNAQKLSKPTDDHNEFWLSLYSLTRAGEIKFYEQNPQQYIEKGYMINPHVYSVINKIIRPMSSVPFDVFEVKDEPTLRKGLKAERRGDAVTSTILKNQSLAELIGQEVLRNFFKHPNECQNWVEWCQESGGFKLLTGNNFIYGLSPVGMDGFYTKGYNLPSQFVEIITGNWQQPVAAYRLLMNSRITFEAKNVVHRKYFNPSSSTEGAIFLGSSVNSVLSGKGGDNYYGMSPLSPLLKVVKRSNDSYIANMRMLENGIPAGILSASSEGENLTPTEKKLLDKAWKKKFGGATNKNEVLTSTARLNWQSMGMNSVDMQLLESNKADLQDIARVYDVPLPLLLQDASTFNNVDAAKKALWENAIIPELNDLRDNLNQFLLPGWEAMTGKKLFIDYDLSGVKALQQNQKELSDRLLKERASALLTGNEFNAAMGRPESEDPIMDQRVISGSLKLIGPDGQMQGDQNSDQLMRMLQNMSPEQINELLNRES